MVKNAKNQIAMDIKIRSFYDNKITSAILVLLYIVFYLTCKAHKSVRIRSHRFHIKPNPSMNFPQNKSY